MTKSDYLQELEKILEAYKAFILQQDEYDSLLAYPKSVTTQAILALNDKAIGEDEAIGKVNIKFISEVYGIRNNLRQELRESIGS